MNNDQRAAELADWIMAEDMTKFPPAGLLAIIKNYFMAAASAQPEWRLPMDFMKFGPKTASLSLMFRNEEEREQFVAMLWSAGVKPRDEKEAGQ